MSEHRLDRELTLSALTGEPVAVDRLLKAWLPQVYQWCARLGGARVDAEDAAQEVLLILSRKVTGIQRPEQVPQWVYTTVRRVVANHRRRAWLRYWMGEPAREVSADALGPERLTDQRQLAHLARRALEALPEAQREVLILCELEERTALEVSALTGVPVGTVKSRLRMAKPRFRQALAELLPDDEVAQWGWRP